MNPALDVIIVGGCGHIGVPLGLAFADRGLTVGLYDINDEAVAQVNRGESPIGEPGTSDVLRRVLSEERLHATGDANSVGRAEHVVVVELDEPLLRRIEVANLDRRGV